MGPPYLRRDTAKRGVPGAVRTTGIFCRKVCTARSPKSRRSRILPVRRRSGVRRLTARKPLGDGPRRDQRARAMRCASRRTRGSARTSCRRRQVERRTCHVYATTAGQRRTVPRATASRRVRKDPAAIGLRADHDGCPKDIRTLAIGRRKGSLREYNIEQRAGTADTRLQGGRAFWVRVADGTDDGSESGGVRRFVLSRRDRRSCRRMGIPPLHSEVARRVKKSSEGNGHDPTPGGFYRMDGSGGAVGANTPKSRHGLEMQKARAKALCQGQSVLPRRQSGTSRISGLAPRRTINGTIPLGQHDIRERKTREVLGKGVRKHHPGAKLTF